MSLDNQSIERRAEFLIGEARSDNPQYCHAVQTTLRVISNFVSFGHWSSRRAKRNPPRMSRGAYELRLAFERDANLTADEKYKRFAAETINEHQEELTRVWHWIVENKESISVQCIVDRLKKFPPIILTRKENAALLSEPDPARRYGNIEIVDVKTGVPIATL